MISTKEPLAREDLIKLFIGFLSQYIVFISSIQRPSQLLLIVNVWLFSILMSSYHGIMQGGLVWGNRWLEDENHISLLVDTALPFVFLLFFLHKNKIMKLFYLLCMSFFITVNVIAASRGGFLGLIIAGFLCWILEKNKFRNFMVVMLSAVLIFSYAPSQLFREIKTLSQGTEEATADDRIYLWRIAIKMFNDSPVLGVGIGNYPYYFSEYENQLRYSSNALRVPHSTPIQWLAETGLIGVFIMFLLQKSLFNSWYLSFKRRKKMLDDGEDSQLVCKISQAVAISQVAFWFCACFLSLLPYPFYWIIIPISEVCRKLLQEQMHTTA